MTEHGRDLWIFGASGAALQVWAVVRALEASHGAGLTLRGFVVQDAPRFDLEGLSAREEADFLAHADPTRDVALIGIGAPRIRAAVAARLAARGIGAPVLVHPSAVIGPRVQIGAGSVVMALAVLETHVNVGEHVLINHGVTVAHECRIGAHSSLGPGVHLAGNVTIGARCDLGVGALARPGVTLGDDLVVGAGAVLVRDHVGPATLIGVPAKPIQ
jgi:sugar O-acyltransferase (sialic acid O-acetyltransferase NeuD family)